MTVRFGRPQTLSMRNVLFLVLAIPCAAAVESGLTIRDSAGWKSPTAEVKAQFANSESIGTLVDVAVSADRSAVASLREYVLDEKFDRGVFEAYSAAVVASVRKAGLRQIGDKTLVEGPVPGYGALFEGKVQDRDVRLVFWVTFAGHTAYRFSWTGGKTLNFESELVRQYWQRIVFPTGVCLSATGPKTRNEELWEEGTTVGGIMILIVIALGVAVIVAIRHARKSELVPPPPST